MIKISENQRFFIDEAGQPFFWLGDTGWPLIAQYTRAEAEIYLANRAQKGFTVIQCVIAWAGGTGYEIKQPMPNYAGDLPWLDGPEHPNDAYFRHVDHLLSFANGVGLTLAMLPIWGYFVNDIHTFNPENGRAYGRWLGERYKNQQNIIWVNGGDRIATGYEVIYRALALGLREGDRGSHLITYHPCGWRSSAQYFHQESWLDFNMIQVWTDWPKIYPAVLADSLLLPTKPVVLAEGAYEDGPEYPLGPITPLVVRRQAWWAFMAGGFYTYGQDQMWRMQPGWMDAFDTPAAGHMTVFKQIATSRPWWKRLPDQGIFDSGVSSEWTLNAAVRSVDSDWAMLYLSSRCHVRLYLDRIAAHQVKATWVNPQTGETKAAGSFATGNLMEGRIFPEGKKQWFTTPDFWEDAVLILDGE
jgi:hypothetical protein